MNESRTIVVGAGLAGLTAAATLARGGRAVPVLEGAEHVAGGRAAGTRTVSTSTSVRTRCTAPVVGWLC